MPTLLSTLSAPISFAELKGIKFDESTRVILAKAANVVYIDVDTDKCVKKHYSQTDISMADAVFLERHHTFKRLQTRGFVKIVCDEADLEKEVASMTSEDKSSQLDQKYLDKHMRIQDRKDGSVTFDKPLARLSGMS
jgi:hypothetical protein